MIMSCISDVDSIQFLYILTVVGDTSGSGLKMSGIAG